LAPKPDILVLPYVRSSEISDESVRPDIKAAGER
jgi:hypothetical protein